MTQFKCVEGMFGFVRSFVLTMCVTLLYNILDLLRYIQKECNGVCTFVDSQGRRLKLFAYTGRI